MSWEFVKIDRIFLFFNYLYINDGDYFNSEKEIFYNVISFLQKVNKILFILKNFNRLIFAKYFTLLYSRNWMLKRRSIIIENICINGD